MIVFLWQHAPGVRCHPDGTRVRRLQIFIHQRRTQRFFYPFIATFTGGERMKRGRTEYEWVECVQNVNVSPRKREQDQS